jgi:hypothetical protein
VHVVEIVEIVNEELFVPGDVLEEASAARYQRLPKKLYLRYQKELRKIYERMKTSKWKTVSESEVNERETFTHW